MNIQEAWAYGRQTLTQASSSPDLDARLLLEHVLQVNHSFLAAHGDDGLSPEEENSYRSLISRAERREPIPYIMGTAEFYGYSFIVNPSVLIPRPETEALVELATAWARMHKTCRIVDTGTGSGCIAISLALNLPKSEIWATDLSLDALSTARKNAQNLAPSRINFIQGDLLSPIEPGVDLIVANLPYVADDEWTVVDDAVKWYEPKIALAGGPDGLDLIRKLLQQATVRLSPGGAIFLEIGWKQGPIAEEIAQGYFPSAIITLKSDFAGHDRYLIIRDVQAGKTNYFGKDWPEGSTSY